VDGEEEDKAWRDLDDEFERAEGNVESVEEVGNGASDCVESAINSRPQQAQL
jgi:hypothetical protein